MVSLHRPSYGVASYEPLGSELAGSGEAICGRREDHLAPPLMLISVLRRARIAAELPVGDLLRAVRADHAVIRRR